MTRIDSAKRSDSGGHAELIRLQERMRKVEESSCDAPDFMEGVLVNPTLEIFVSGWTGLGDVLRDEGQRPVPGEETLLLWKDPESGAVRVEVAKPDDLLALKMVCERLDPRDVAAMEGVPVGVLDTVMRRAAARGMLITPPSALLRNASWAIPGERFGARDFFSSTFVMQWHITQACDLHCRHCYDRSAISSLRLDQGERILDDLRMFCLDRSVRGQVTFTGGNPFLHPDFFVLYQGAVNRGLGTAILGNPVSGDQLDRMLDIAMPGFYQVSLEGLAEHNDYIRGTGHFARTLSFLDALRTRGVFSMVMLTLTSANMDQVLPLAEMLRDRVDAFTFTRLAEVGEGADLQGVSPDLFPGFLSAYLDAAATNPVMWYKDNLLNCALELRGEPLFSGCSGGGCGAAFSFFAVLPDGRAHACRKFPSPIGNVLTQGVAEVYDSQQASRYREGSRACRECGIRPGCGGCMAVAHGRGLNVFEDRDPYCFLGSTVEG